MKLVYEHELINFINKSMIPEKFYFNAVYKQGWELHQFRLDEILAAMEPLQKRVRRFETGKRLDAFNKLDNNLQIYPT